MTKLKSMKVMFKRNWIHSLLIGSCPRCRQGAMYALQNPYRLGRVYDMKNNCEHCHLKFKIEPSFFYGAMYVSYGLGVALGIALFIISYYLFRTTPFGSFITIVIALIVLAPLIMRISRNIWISLFVKYNKLETLG